MQAQDHGHGDDAGFAVPHYSRAAALGLTFRSRTPEDMDFLAGLYASTREEELAPLPWTDEQKASFLRQQFNAQQAHYLEHYPDASWLVIERQGQPVGRLYIEVWPSQHRIIDIAFLPLARGRGFGTALLSDVTDVAATSGKAVSIHVEKNNPAMALYRRLGFVTIEDKGVYDLMEWHASRLETLTE